MSMQAEHEFYVVSRRKLAILFLATSSLYVLYWYYKNWDRYKSRHPEASQFGSMVSPVPRAVFWMFFTHALFRKVKAHGHALPQVAGWRSGWHATIVVALMLLANAIDVLIGGTAGDLVSIASVFVLLPPFLTAQDKINLSCGDPEGKSNDRLSKANWAWVVAGGVLWLILIAAALLPGGS
jgi:hypothetical protein